MAQADHIAQREAVGPQRRQANSRQQRRAPAACQQIVTEEDHNPSQPQRRSRPEAGRRALTKEQIAVDGVIQHRHGEDHRLQTGVDVRRRGIKTPEVKAEDAAPLQHAKQVIPQRQLA